MVKYGPLPNSLIDDKRWDVPKNHLCSVHPLRPFVCMGVGYNDRSDCLCRVLCVPLEMLPGFIMALRFFEDCSTTHHNLI